MLVEADGDSRVGSRNLQESEDSPRAVEPGGGDRAGGACQHRFDERRVGKSPADPVLGTRISGQHDAAAVDEQRGDAFAAGERIAEPTDPFEIDTGGDHPRYDRIRSADGQRGHDRGRPLQPAEQIVAQNEIAGAQGLLEIRTIGEVEADRVREIRAGDPSVGADDQQALHPPHVGTHVGNEPVAARGSTGRIAAGDHLQHRARRQHDLLLRFDAAAGEAGGLLRGGGHAVDPLGLKQPDAVEQQRCDRQGDEHEDPGAMLSAGLGRSGARHELRSPCNMDASAPSGTNLHPSR